MTKEELAQKIKDSDYTCRGISCRECISINGFGCCLQADKKLFVSMFLSSQNQEYAELQKRIAELEKENAELKDDNKVMADNYSKMEQKFCDNLTKAKGLLKKIEKIVYSGENEIKRLSQIVDILTEAEQFLLDNSDEYARQRAIDYLKEEKK